MHRSNVPEKASKTFFLLCAVNLCMAPFLSQSTTGLLSMLIINGALITHLHSIGKRRRPGANAITAANGFFTNRADQELNEVDNALRNIINGGAALFDDICRAVLRR